MNEIQHSRESKWDEEKKRFVEDVLKSCEVEHKKLSLEIEARFKVLISHHNNKTIDDQAMTNATLDQKVFLFNFRTKNSDPTLNQLTKQQKDIENRIITLKSTTPYRDCNLVKWVCGILDITNTTKNLIEVTLNALMNARRKAGVNINKTNCTGEELLGIFKEMSVGDLKDLCKICKFVRYSKKNREGLTNWLLVGINGRNAKLHNSAPMVIGD